MTLPAPAAFLTALLEAALRPRWPLFDAAHETALRLFNGFLEGYLHLVAEVFAKTLVLHSYSQANGQTDPWQQQAELFYRSRLPWLEAVVVKQRGVRRSSTCSAASNGDRIATRLCEHGVWYALDLLRHQDTTFYLDTRGLRQWAIQNLKGKSVLNTFAYTGSLGVAAMAGGAHQVLHIDRNRDFLELAQASYALNGFPVRAEDFWAMDFFPAMSALRRAGELFDCVFLDPPFFSVTGKGRVDLVSESARLINKVRPLVTDGGWLVAVNNALFVSGAAYLRTLQALCADGYMSIETLIPVPEDCTGYPSTRVRSLPSDPAPFNHATKIAVLRLRRKECRATRETGWYNPRRDGLYRLARHRNYRPRPSSRCHH